MVKSHHQLLVEALTFQVARRFQLPSFGSIRENLGPEHADALLFLAAEVQTIVEMRGAAAGRVQ